MPVPTGQKPKRVVLYVIDALRPDRLEVYGHTRSTAPCIAEIARGGARFTRCFSNSTWSLASIRSVFHGSHGAAYRRDAPPGRVPDQLELLAEHLRAAGMRTGIVSENLYVSARYGLTQGFDYVGESYALLESGQDKRAAASATRGHLTRFLDECGEAPFFLYVHTMEAHAPLIAPDGVEPLYAPGTAPRDDLEGWYDTGICWADQNLAAFVAQLEARGLYDDTLLMITADHGESLYRGESGGTHRGPPLRERIHVPLAVHWPKRIPPGTVVDANVQLLDLGPTILEALRLPSLPQHQGLSLTRLLAGEADPRFAGRPIVAAGEGMKGRALVLGDWYYLRANGKEQLFDLRGGVLAGQDVIGDHRAVARELAGLAGAHIAAEQARYEASLSGGGLSGALESVRRAFGGAEAHEAAPAPDAKHQEALEALGYL